MLRFMGNNKIESKRVHKKKVTCFKLILLSSSRKYKQIRLCVCKPRGVRFNRKRGHFEYTRDKSG